MSIVLPVNYENKHSYDIVITNSYNDLTDALSDFSLQTRKLCIVTESNVGPIYVQTVSEELKKITDKVFVYQFDAGEKSKNLDTVYSLYEYLIKNKFDRNDVLIALGGGVVGDLTGFAASTYLRGIRFIQLPTSLLSQVDSSIGGKTGVDFKGYKNMVGAFKQPTLVYINISTLCSLHTREYLSGMGEIIKHGIIKNKDYFNWLDSNYDKVLNLDEEALIYMISESCKIKRAVVEIDPKETLGERALLNFGHTYGHSIEKLMNFNLLHGECVSIGMVGALELSKLKGYISQDDVSKCITVLEKYKLPISVTGLDSSDVIDTMYSDKKMDAGTLKFALVNKIGNAFIDKTSTREELLTTFMHFSK